MIINKIIFGVFLFLVLYYFSDRKNISWCLYGVIVYILLLIVIEYLNSNNEVVINQQIEDNLNSLKNKNNEYIANQRNLVMENFQDSMKLVKESTANKLPHVKYGKLDLTPTAHNTVEHVDKKVNDRKLLNINKLKRLDEGTDINQYFKPNMDRIQVSNLDYNMGLVLENKNAYENNVNNQLFYSMYGGVSNSSNIGRH